MRKALAAAGVVAVITAGSAACGTNTTTPQGKVADAFQKLSQQNTVTMDLGFGGSADQIYASLKDESGFTRGDANLLASLHLSLGVSSKQSFSLLGKSHAANTGSVSFALSTDGSGGKTLVEVRVVDQKLYLRADIKGLEKLNPNGASSSSTAQLDQFLAGADRLPSSLASVKAALKGEWISIDPKAFADFAKGMMGGANSGSGTGTSTLPGLPATPKLDAKTQAQIIAALKKALATNVTYKDLGSRDGADHVQVSVPARQLATAVKNGLGPVVKNVPGYRAGALNSLDGVPNKTLAVDVAIKGGSVSAITFDIAQLDTKAHGALPLTLTLDSSAKPVSAPAGAQVLNPQDIMGLVMSTMGRHGSAGSGSSFDTSSSL